MPACGKQAERLASDDRLTSFHLNAAEAKLGRRERAAANRDAAATIRKQASEADDAGADRNDVGASGGGKCNAAPSAVAIRIGAVEVKAAN